MEVISFGTPNDKPPLLFVHGSFCGAWVWSPYFIPAFTAGGWWGAAISLRGHGKSEGLENINSFGVEDYLQDIEEASKLFNQPPILIGHSLGGYLIQKFALDHPVRGLVLLSSPSLLGLNGSVQHIALNRPLLAMQLGALMTMGPKHTNMRVISKSLFNDSKAAKSMEDLLPLMQRESARVSLEASWPDFRRPQNSVPTLALGGDKDAFIPEFEIRYASHFWNGQSKVLPGVSHGVMLDSCWPTVAKEIMGWLIGTAA